MPGGRKMIWVNGRRASVPEDQLENTLQGLDSAGIKFSLDDPSGGGGPEAQMTVGEPEVLHQQHGASGEWGDDQDMGFMESFANRAKGWPGEFEKAGEGFIRGANQSLYQGGADEVAAGARALGGEDFGSALKGEQAARDQAWDETPITYGAGRVAGYIPGMMMGAAAGPAKAGWEAVKAAGKRVGQGMGMSAVNGFLSDDGDLESRAGSAARDAAIAAPFGIAGEALTAAAPAVDQAGIALRRANAGGSQGELNAIRLDKGLDQMQSGVDQDFADLGLANSWKPQSAYGVANKLEKQTIPQAGQQMGGAIDAATDAGVRGSWGSVRGLMDNAAGQELRGSLGTPTTSQRGFVDELGRISRDELPDTTPAFNPGMAVPPGQQIPPVGPSAGPGLADRMVANKANQQINRLNEPAPQFHGPDQDWLSPERIDPSDEFSPFRNVLDEATPRELQSKKNAFEAEGYPKEGTVRLESDAPRKDAYRTAAGAARGELGDVMSGTDFYPDFNQGRETIEKASPIAAMAGQRAAANKAGSSMVNPVALTAGLSGAGAGFLGGGIPGAVAGGTAGLAANYAARNYGQDVAGMGARGMSAAMGGAGQMMAQGAQRAAGPMSGIAGQQPPQQQNNSNGLPGGTRGYLTPDVAKSMLQKNPQAFGPYTQQFNQAQQSGDPGEMVRLLDRLENTDERWKQQYLPMLLGQTGGQM